MRRLRGVSMIEVVVTMAILAILVTAAAPSLGDWMTRTRVRSAAESVQNGLNQARMEAVRRNRAVGFHLVSSLGNDCRLSRSGPAWVVSATSPAGKCGEDPNWDEAPQLLGKGEAASGSLALEGALADADTGATSVTFNGFGMLQQAAAASALQRINVSAGDDHELLVEVSAGGAARVC